MQKYEWLPRILWVTDYQFSVKTNISMLEDMIKFYRDPGGFYKKIFYS